MPSARGLDEFTGVLAYSENFVAPINIHTVSKMYIVYVRLHRGRKMSGTWQALQIFPEWLNKWMNKCLVLNEYLLAGRKEERGGKEKKRHPWAVCLPTVWSGGPRCCWRGGRSIFLPFSPFLLLCYCCCLTVSISWFTINQASKQSSNIFTDKLHVTGLLLKVPTCTDRWRKRLPEQPEKKNCLVPFA